MEPKVYLLIRRFDESTLEKLNSAHRWLFLRHASADEIAIPSNTRHRGWAGYVACDGSGIYNGAFGPARRKLMRRKSGRTQDQSEKFGELVVGGQILTVLEIRNVLRSILNCSLDLIMSLRTSTIVAENIDHLLLASPVYDIDTEPSADIEVFKEANQAFHITQHQQSTNNPMDRSGRPTAS